MTPPCNVKSRPLQPETTYTYIYYGDYFFSLLRIDGPLVSRFDYKVFTSVTKRICKLSVVLIFLLVTIYPESFIHLFIFYHFHYEHLCWKP